jgi:hypothetical protein
MNYACRHDRCNCPAVKDERPDPNLYTGASRLFLVNLLHEAMTPKLFTEWHITPISIY